MVFKKKILVITSLDDLQNVKKILEKYFIVHYEKNINETTLKKIINNYFAIFTNPNNTKIYFGEKIFKIANNLKIICTASTGTTHIDLKIAKLLKIKILSLKEERKTINKISSTAELALGLTINSLRNITSSYQSVLNNKWDYSPYIGNQLNFLNVGVAGYGRLGKFYCKFLKTLGSNIFVFDPYKNVKNKNYIQINSLNYFLSKCDILSIHIHYNRKNHEIINRSWFSKMKKNIILINTSRGEVINECDLITFLKKNKKAKYSTDVVSNETQFKKNKLIKYAKNNKNIFITPHLGGMTYEARNFAYTQAAKKLIKIYKGLYE